MKQFLKDLLGFLHISLTRNQRYDADTRKIMRSVLKADSNCIDIGCHKGEILDLMLRWAPQGTMFAFEPIPELFDFLKKKYRLCKRVTIARVALSDTAGTTPFQHVLNAPAYSGIKKRRYDNPNVRILEITVPSGTLDDFIPDDIRIDLMKVDVEGGEYHVLKGGAETIKRSRPLIIFEFGMGAADCYGIRPEDIFRFITGELGLKINTLRGYLGNAEPLTESELENLYACSREYYFIAYP